MWDLPRPGLEPVSPALAGRFSTTAPPGKPKYPFITAWRSHFSICYSASLLVMNTLSFCLFGNVSISPSFLKDNFTGYTIFQDIPERQFFSSRTLKMSSHCPWHHYFWWEISSQSYWGSLVHKSLSWCFKTSLFGGFDNLTIMCFSVALSVYILLGVHWALEHVYSRLSSDLESFRSLSLQICFSAPFFLSFPSNIPIMCMLLYLMVSHRSLRLCSSFFILFSLCSADCASSTFLPFSLLIFCPASSKVLFNSSGEFVISVLYFPAP